MLLRRGAPRLLDATGRRTPLGLGAAGATVVRTHLVAGDRILFYTDGMAEARHPRTREFFPVLPAVQAAFGPARLADLVAALRRWTEATLGDDVALLAAEFAPPARAEAPCADQPAQVRADAPWRAPDGKREVPRSVTGFTNGADDARRHHGDGPARADITTARRREAIG
ncbi:SpoIIE family protein phosphatase [Candidatus Frankia alpina]|uniref:SpoIIE family protein phosphatase n=1 Tax=Candidatus Frankia alpina TaxID=2699483 RepID=UPI0022A690F6|nr:SpoIIE family protein phosphatase [Candidatus Frankia alpina]